MKEGIVKFFNRTKGFGFITPNEGGEDVFVHQTGLVDVINEEDNVTYEEIQGKKGINATNVRIVND